MTDLVVVPQPGVPHTQPDNSPNDQGETEMTTDVVTHTRPCRYCTANWAGMANQHPIPGADPILPTAQDCEFEHRDDPRVYALARAMAKVAQGRHPSDEQIAWFLGDADDVIDDFDPAPEKWRVRKLPASANDYDQGIDCRLRINDVTYVALEGGKDSRGSVVKLATFRSWDKP